MSKAFALMAVLSVCVLGGCKSDNGQTTDSSRGEMKSQRVPTAVKADACTHCDGMQVAKADGTCPICGRQATKPR